METTAVRFVFRSKVLGAFEVAKEVADGLVAANIGGTLLSNVAAMTGKAGAISPMISIVFGVLSAIFFCLRLGLAGIIKRSKAIDPVE